MKTLAGFWLVVFFAFECTAQVFQVEINSEPLVANERGEIVPLSQAANLSPLESEAAPMEVMSPDAVFSQLRDLYRYCPGLVSAFEKMRSTPQLRMNELDGFDKFSQLLDEALLVRRRMMEEAKAFGSSPIFLKTKFVDRVLASEREADYKLSECFDELVPPNKLPSYFVAIGPGYDNNLLTSHLLSKFANISKADFNRRLAHSRDFLEWAVDAAYDEKRDLTVGREKLRLVYAELSVQQFLDMTYILGKSKAGETIEQYMARNGKLPTDTAQYVSAISAAMKKNR